MSLYTIQQTDMGSGHDELFLNHAYMSDLSFGSKEMAWVTPDKEKAELMCEKCWGQGSRAYGAYSEFEVVDLFGEM